MEWQSLPCVIWDPFGPYHAPDASGIYVARTDSAALYVGRADLLSRRLKVHMWGGLFSLFGADPTGLDAKDLFYYGMTHIGRVECFLLDGDLIAAEKSAVNHFRPVFNRGAYRRDAIDIRGSIPLKPVDWINLNGEHRKDRARWKQESALNHKRTAARGGR